MKPLQGRIAVVAGATRGAGRGIATMLGEAGATVYCTGRTTRALAATRRPDTDAPFALEHRRETIEDTAEKVTALGGVGIPVQVDHTDRAQVAALFARVRDEQGGRLDVLVNDIWGGDAFIEFGKPLWESDLDKGFQMLRRAIDTHVITAHFGLPLMVANGRGLVVEVTDGDGPGYRGQFFYDLVKNTVIRLAFTLSEELRPHGVACVAVTPGFLRSEAMLEHFGVTEANWRDGAEKDPNFIESETPAYVGRAVAALAADPRVFEKSGQTWASWDLAKEYGFTDVDGRRPDWGSHFLAASTPGLDAWRDAQLESERRFFEAFPAAKKRAHR